MKPGTVILIGVLAFLAYRLMDKRLDQQEPLANSNAAPPPTDRSTAGGGDLFSQIANVFRDATKVVSQVSQHTT